MPVNRFEKLRRLFHCNANSKAVPAGHTDFDKLFKVRPGIDSILKKCRYLPQEERHSIDGQMLPTKGRMSLKQYCPKKPHKFGIKVVARCGVS